MGIATISEISMLIEVSRIVNPAALPIMSLIGCPGRIILVPRSPVSRLLIQLQ